MSKWGKIGRDSYLAGKGKEKAGKKVAKAIIRLATKKKKR